jgi:hypothetical protein
MSAWKSRPESPVARDDFDLSGESIDAFFG